MLINHPTTARLGNQRGKLYSYAETHLLPFPRDLQILHEDTVFFTTDIFSRGQKSLSCFSHFVIQRLLGELCTNLRFCWEAAMNHHPEKYQPSKGIGIFLILLFARSGVPKWSKGGLGECHQDAAVSHWVAAKPRTSTQPRAVAHPSPRESMWREERAFLARAWGEGDSSVTALNAIWRGILCSTCRCGKQQLSWALIGASTLTWGFWYYPVAHAQFLLWFRKTIWW